MVRLILCAWLAGLVLSVVAVPEAAAQKKKVDVTKLKDGSVDDDRLMKPEVVVSQKHLDAMWKAWKVAGKTPEVDFTKNLVVAVYSVGSKLNLGGANLDKGNLDVLGFGTRDIRPGFRFVLGVVSKEGVKTVNGKALPTE
jgi:hypothetical protein